MDERNEENDPIEARKLGKVFRFTDDLNPINDDGEFEANYCDKNHDELQQDQENTDEYEASFLDLDIKMKDEKFQVGLFDEKDSLPFSVVRLPDTSRTYPLTLFILHCLY